MLNVVIVDAMFMGVHHLYEQLPSQAVVLAAIPRLYRNSYLRHGAGLEVHGHSVEILPLAHCSTRRHPVHPIAATRSMSSKQMSSMTCACR
jgi:hypothetical protein